MLGNRAARAFFARFKAPSSAHVHRGECRHCGTLLFIAVSGPYGTAEHAIISRSEATASLNASFVGYGTRVLAFMAFAHRSV